MKILVTGGMGFIGSAFLNRFVPLKPDVSFVNVDSLTYAGNPLNLSSVAGSPKYRFVHLDLRDAEAILGLFQDEQPDVVVHFAAETHVDRSIHFPRQFVESNVLGTLNLLEGARAVWKDYARKRFHHVSTDEVYGALEEHGAFLETTAYDPSSPYSASKAASDHLVRAYHRTYGMPVTITNCSNNYGPRQFPEKLIPLMILNASEGKPLPVYGSGANIRDWLYVDDHCDAIWKVLESDRIGETYNIGGRTEKTNLEVVQCICEAVADELGKDRDELLKLITFVADRPGHDFRYAIDCSKIERDLDWKPAHTFEAGLRETVRWYLGQRDWIDSVRSGQYRNWLEQNYAGRI